MQLRITLEMDCKEVVDACHSIRTDYSEFGSLIKECKTLFSHGTNLKLCFIKRQANRVAHALDGMLVTMLALHIGLRLLPSLWMP